MDFSEITKLVVTGINENSRPVNTDHNFQGKKTPDKTAFSRLCENSKRRYKNTAQLEWISEKPKGVLPYITFQINLALHQMEEPERYVYNPSQLSLRERQIEMSQIAAHARKRYFFWKSLQNNIN